MAYPNGERWLYLVTLLRRIATTAAATAIGVFNVVTERPESPVELKPGYPAPDFSLAGSDGRTYRLKELAGVVVIAVSEGVHRRPNGQCTSLGRRRSCGGRRRLFRGQR
jgi:hypothetical protein